MDVNSFNQRVGSLCDVCQFLTSFSEFPPHLEKFEAQKCSLVFLKCSCEFLAEKVSPKSNNFSLKIQIGEKTTNQKPFSSKIYTGHVKYCLEKTAGAVFTKSEKNSLRDHKNQWHFCRKNVFLEIFPWTCSYEKFAVFFHIIEKSSVPLPGKLC